MSEEVRKALKRMVRKQLAPEVITGKVVAVFGTDTCDVEPSDGGAVLYDVRLRVSQNSADSGAFSVPKKGSQVVCVQLAMNANNWAVIAVEDIEEHIVKVNGNAELRVKPNGNITINGDQYGGLVKVQELRTELDKVTSFLNTLRNAINSAGAGPDAAPFKAALSAALGPLPLPSYTNIESDKTKHGSL